MKTEKKIFNFWIIIICLISLLFFIQVITQLSFINNKYNLFFRVIAPIIFVISINKSILKNEKNMKLLLFIICIVFISSILLHSIFFEQMIYITEIDLTNNRGLIVKEHSIMGEYSIDFYEKKYILFKQPLHDSYRIVTDNIPFYSGEYSIEYVDYNKAIIKYRNSRFKDIQEIIIQF